MEQGSQEWLQARAGRVTASKVADIVSRTKAGAYTAARANYMTELLIERVTGIPTETYVSREMQWGRDYEPQARELYAFETDSEVETVGFIEHPVIAMSGASPDCMVSHDGLAEFKAPNTSTHVKTMLSGEIPAEYAHQMNWQMACTGRLYCDFVSYDPRCPASMRLFIKRLHRDTSVISDLEAEVSKFIAELDAMIQALEAKGYGITPTFDDEQVMAAAQ